MKYKTTTTYNILRSKNRHKFHFHLLGYSINYLLALTLMFSGSDSLLLACTVPPALSNHASGSNFTISPKFSFPGK
jgi:hypothetical protein